ncbi:CubicO group peptidase, beta-lactamase class C family [Chitinophaga terrae (ex Kim and Jung 2007)]|uniref:CubicO group peptidase, beta-lactamase class C family n=1 Tax=Chitinophaga terrae (ex Kim and Jung 2007) TaxID=408074 RepID=A0A1H4CAI1_9BACT|nr:serine hydrolase domain-containing protein [Chitinophaga terrae (ex Kim and Jung 2007)]MDQ0110096.1 CubicO group peptidase (beta-lactamase class C family) [Chitinophaga terrae (ex Kim and Jung 2007)]GEP88850.1 penicillin-binding protein [Chitinophaga terrae (ex Kim and Jung 2007)]SEA57330.1 CubicO group peptidase, beta-lactamase class C family [Chitinophaga terrae (ex Kim and Jung 2007)]
MKRLKAVRIILTLSGIAIVTSCQSNSASSKTNSHRAVSSDSSRYTLNLSDAEKNAILNSPRTQQIQRELEAYYTNKLLRTGFNGAVLVAKKGVVIFEKYHGYENSRSKTPVIDSSSFQLASVSKTFTGGAALWLVQNGQLSLDATLQEFFPNFPYKGITVRMLLNHRSGLPNYLYFCDSLWKDPSRYMTNEDVIRLMEVHKPKIQHAPGTHFQYCNTNYMLLASIIEKVSGKKYPEFMQETIFQPLGMHNTFVFQPGTIAHPHQTQSHKYNGQFEPDTYFDGVMGDKGIYSTVQDMLKWDQALYSGQLLNDSILKMAYTPYSNEKPGVRNYGLGWRLMVYPDATKNIVYHNGWWHGNNTVFYRFIQDSTTLIILGNKYDRAIYQSVKPIREILGHGDGEEAGEE